MDKAVEKIWHEDCLSHDGPITESCESHFYGKVIIDFDESVKPTKEQIDLISTRMAAMKKVENNG